MEQHWWQGWTTRILNSGKSPFEFIMQEVEAKSGKTVTSKVAAAVKEIPACPTTSTPTRQQRLPMVQDHKTTRFNSGNKEATCIGKITVIHYDTKSGVKADLPTRSKSYKSGSLMGPSAGSPPLISRVASFWVLLTMTKSKISLMEQSTLALFNGKEM